MIKLVIFPSRREAITQRGWDFLKAIGDHISKTTAYSLTEYAVSFSEFAKNIELAQSFFPVYHDGSIKLYTSVDWNNRSKQEVKPFASIEIDNIL